MKVYNHKAVKSLTLFSIPIILGQIGVMLISAGDMYVAAAHSTLSVGAIGVATGVFNPVFLFGIGLMMGLSPALAIERGTGKNIEQHFLSSIVFAILAGIFLCGVMLVVNEFVPMMGIESEMVPFIQRYNKIIAWSFPLAFVFQAVKEFLQSFEDVFFANLISIVAVFVNLGLNYFFVFGVENISGMGFDGLAYASFSIRVFLMLTILIYARKYFKNSKVDFEFIKRTFKFSLPIASMFFIEVLAFCVVAILAGGMGVGVSAANSIITNIASITFMVPLSISSAVSVKVGAKFGEGNNQGVKDYAFSSLFMSSAFMVFSALIYIFFPEFLMRLVTSDPYVVEIGVGLLFIVAIFQIVDGLQITLGGILRGLAMTKEPFISILVGYWALGIPFGVYLAFNRSMNAQGLWIGLAVSLTIVALFLGLIFRKRLVSLQSQ
jgi:MATE family multidrug resistance protein